MVGAGAGSWNLHLGNHPLAPEGYGSAWGFSSIKEELRRRASRRAEKHWVAQAVACRHRAVDYIHRHPVAFAHNGLDRCRMIWAMDLFLLLQPF